MFGTILKATNSSFQKGMTFCRSIYMKKVMKLLAFIFEQPSYLAHYIFKTILVAVRFIKGGKTLAIHKKTCLLHVYDKRTGLRLLSVS